MTRTVAFCILLALSPNVYAQTSSQLGFDWRKHPTTGDVTVPISQNQRDNVFHVGPGRITLTASITLLQAILNDDSLTLKFEVHDPQQTVQFEDLQGASGDYKPAGWKARRIAISNSPHTERFVRKGVFTLNVRKPATPPRSRARTPEERSSSLLPGPESGYKPRSEAFARLAAAISGKYKMPGRDTHRSYALQWEEAAAAAAKYPSEDLQRIAHTMLERAKEDRNLDPRAIRASLLRDAQDIERRVANGEFRRREGSYDTGPLGERIPVFRSIDGSGEAQREAERLRRLASSSDAQVKEWALRQRHQNGWLDLFFGSDVSNNPDHQYQQLQSKAFKLLVSEAQRHAGPPSTPPLVDVIRPDSSTLKLRNVSDKMMTDTTMSISFGFTRSDKAKQLSVPILLFVPVWKPNEDLELSFELKEPFVMHVKANVYANEASKEDCEFVLPDPQSPPDKRPGTIVLSSNQPVGRDVEVWAEINSERVNWNVGEQQLELPTEPGMHQVAVQSKNRQRVTTVYEGTVSVDAGQRVPIRMPKDLGTQPKKQPPANASADESRADPARIAQQNKQALQLLNLAKQALAAKNRDLARRYLQQVIAVAPDSPAAKQAERLMKNVER